MLEALRTGESMEISGTYRGSRVVSLARQTRPAHMIVVDTPDGRKNIILGPAWFIEDDDLALQPGDEISVVGKRAKFKGRTIAAAWSIEQGEDRWEFWDGEDANWLTD